jgi:uncharacterized membrane protein YbhN (UPF0104 family)
VEWAEERKAAAKTTLTANRIFSPFCLIIKIVFFLLLLLLLVLFVNFTFNPSQNGKKKQKIPKYQTHTHWR